MHRVWRGRERTIRDGHALSAWVPLVVAAVWASVPAGPAMATGRAPSTPARAAVADAQPPGTDAVTLPTVLAYRCGDRDVPRFTSVSVRGTGTAADEPGAAGDALRATVAASGTEVPADGWYVVASDATTRWVLSAPLGDGGGRQLIGLALGADGAWSAVVNEPCDAQLTVDGGQAASWSLVPEGWLSRAQDQDRLDLMVDVPCVSAGAGRFVRFRPGPTAIAELTETVLIAPTLVPDGMRAHCEADPSMRVRVPVPVAGRSLVDVSRPDWATRWGPTVPGSTPAPSTPAGRPWPVPIRRVAYRCDGGGPAFLAGWSQQVEDAQARDDEIGAIIRRWISTETAWPAVGYRTWQVGPDELHVLARAEPPDGTWWVDGTIERVDGVWQEIHNYGDCTPRAAARDSVYLTWTLDPAYPVRSTDRLLHLRLTLPRCFESVYPVTWDAQPAIVREDRHAVYLIVGAKQRTAGRCRGDLVLRQTARLSRPLGDRAVVDADSLPLTTIRP